MKKPIALFVSSAPRVTEVPINKIQVQKQKKTRNRNADAIRETPIAPESSLVGRAALQGEAFIKPALGYTALPE
jgi:hypothetical protein